MAERTCSRPECRSRHYAKGLCRSHYESDPTGMCAVEGCDKPTTPKTAKGLCVRHYKRLTTNGHLGIQVYYKPWLTAPEILLERSEPDGECILWTGALSSDGYGSVAGLVWMGYYRAHRFSWFLANGPVPEGLELDHTCHTSDAECEPTDCRHRRCINPDHLEVVTHAENTRRRAARVA